MDDDALLVAARSDPEAFGRVFDHHHAPLRQWFVVRTFSAETANELVAETFAVALAKLDRFDPAVGSAGAWLQGIAHNLFRSWLRRRRVESRGRKRLHITVDLTVGDDAFDLVDARLELQALAGPLRDAIDGLSPALRDAVRLRVIEELPYEEVAARLSCSVGAARVRVSRALAVLLEELR